jgi:heat-inducible transcriptional repressor
MTELDERKAAILRAIVEHYVDSAQPVGSQTVTQTAGLGVSAATVRNEMSVLERDGFIAQPHTSAGRVPTDSGYRYYVDHLAGAGALAPAERRRIADFFTSATMAMDDLLHETSQLLARVTAHAAVVVGPQPESVHVRSVHLALLQPRLLLAVVVMSNGAVEKETVVLEAEVAAEDVGTASARLAAHLAGRRLAELAGMRYSGTYGDRADALARASCDALAAFVRLHHDEPLYVGGASRLAAEQEAFASTSASGLLELLEQHVVLGALLRELLGPGLTVRIGAENELADLRECSLVLAPYLVEGEPIGTVGVLGPTRMDYRKAQAAVSTVSRQLGQQLSR